MKKFRFKLSFVFKRIISGLLAIVLLVFLPFVGMGSDGNAELIYNVFVGAKSKYQGIIEVWNIDTFESGTVSKTNLLNVAAKKFQEKNKGLYVLVRNVTENECLNMINDGQLPDMFSCSYGVAVSIKETLLGFDENAFDIYKNFLDAGKNQEGEQLGVSWCAGFYYLISTKLNLQKAKVVGDEINLLESALEHGYEVESKKKTKTVYSLDFGMGKYLVPQMAIASYNENKKLSVSEKSFNAQNIKSSSYSAYCRFVASESVMLLGTQRDVFRMKNREVNGKVSDVIYQPLTKYTDLVQFMFMAKGESDVKNFYKQEFAKFLTSDYMQKKVVDVGLFSVKNIENVAIKQGVMQDITPENIANCKVNNVFLTKTEIDNLRDVFDS